MKRLLVMACCWAPLAFGQRETLTLERAELLAVKNHPQLRAAEFTAQATEYGITEAKSNLYPNFVASVTGVGAAPSSNLAAGGISSTSAYNKFATGTTATQLITDFGRTSRLVESAKLHSQAQQQTTNATRAQVLLQVDRAYFAVLRSQAVQRIAERTVATRQVIADQVTTLANSKLKSGLDVSFANVNLAEARLLLASARNDLQASQAELSASLGLSQMREFDLAEAPAPPKLLDAPSDYLREAMQGRPDLENRRVEQQSAKQFAEAEKALRYPSLSAVAGIGVIPGHDEKLSGRYAAAGLNINFPVLNGHLYSARRSEAELRAQASTQNTLELQNRIARDVQVAWLAANTAFQRIALTDELLRQANLALDLAQARYELGLSSIVELTQAQLNQTTAEIQNTQARYDYQVRLAELNYQAGLLK